VIPIALSYKIIKNSLTCEDREKHLQAMDVADFMFVQEEEAEESAEDDPKKIMETEIRTEIERETARKRKAILESAALEIEEIKETTKRESSIEGYNEGFQKGFEEGRLEAEDMRGNAISLIEDAGKKIKAYCEENEGKILSLSVRIAEKIIHQTIDFHSENVMLLAKPILQEYGKAENIIISCNPGNVDFVRSRFHEIEKLCPNAHVLILEDKSLEKNGVVIENENQITDLQIKKQLERFLELANS